MTDPRFTDPMRRIASVKEGSGSDQLTLECGHVITRTHRARWGKSTRCHGCRVWKERP